MEDFEEVVSRVVESLHQQTEVFVIANKGDPATHTLAKWPVQERWLGEWIVCSQVVALVPTREMSPGRTVAPEGYPHATLVWKMRVGPCPNLPPALPAEFLAR